MAQFLYFARSEEGSGRTMRLGAEPEDAVCGIQAVDGVGCPFSGGFSVCCCGELVIPSAPRTNSQPGLLLLGQPELSLSYFNSESWDNRHSEVSNASKPNTSNLYNPYVFIYLMRLLKIIIYHREQLPCPEY